MTYKFINPTLAVAVLATFTTLASPSSAAAQGDDMKYQVYKLQQTLQATNARVDELEKALTKIRAEISSWASSSKQQSISYPSSSPKPDRQTPSAQAGTIHHVASGDTLSSLSRRYGLGLDRIIGANPGLDPHRIRIGQPITIPGSGAGAPAKQSSTPAAVATGSYRVQGGDTLSSIARRHNTSTTELLALNSLKNPNALSVGQAINVPGSGSSAPAPSGNRYGGQQASTPTPAPAPAPAPESSSEVLTAPEGHGYYEVVSKDTLYSIALSFGTTSRELRRLNKLQGDDELSVGDYILVPVADDSLYES